MPFQTEHLNYVVAMIIRLDVFMYFHPVVWIGWLVLVGREFFFPRFSLLARRRSPHTHPRISIQKQNDFRDLCIDYIDTNSCVCISIDRFAYYCGYHRGSDHGVHCYYILVRTFFFSFSLSLSLSLSLCNPRNICTKQGDCMSEPGCISEALSHSKNCNEKMDVFWTIQIL